VREDVKCGECGSPMVLRETKRFPQKDGTPGKFYGCSTFPACRGTHGAHPSGEPLGVPADAATKQARIRAHAAFDKLWKGGLISRKEAYDTMRRELGYTDETGHIGRFGVEECERLIKWAEEGMRHATS
jgi:ssDNA-binding Zn-finger/Zn-ribbon topoisomerase 1